MPIRSHLGNAFEMCLATEPFHESAMPNASQKTAKL